ncbi:MAG: tetratricopeptide repeat protein [Thermodesulfobacteriota bacterium]
MEPGNLGKLSKREILSYIADIIAIGGLLYGAIRIIRGDIGLITLIVLIVCASGIWLSSFFFYIRRAKYHKWVGNLALALIIAMPVLAFTGYFGWRYYQSMPPDKIIILLADFDGPDKKKYRVTGNIKDQLEKATKKYSDVEVQLLNETITYQNESDYARKIGKKRKASIVLWGEYTVNEENVQIIAHFEVLERPVMLELKQEVENLKVGVTELRNFTIQEQLSNEMTYLVLFTIGLARYEAGDYAGAISLFTDAVSGLSVPVNIVEPAALYFYRASAYYLNNDPDRAIEDYSRSIVLNPSNPTAYANRGICYADKGKLDAAIHDYTKAIELNSKESHFYYNRGNAYLIKGDLVSAINDFTTAIGLNPRNYLAYHNRGTSYALQGDLDSAVRDFTSTIELNPKDSDAYISRGKVYSKKNLYDLAISDYTKAIEFNPRAAALYFQRGNTYMMKNDIRSAIRDYTKTIEIDPKFVDAYVNRGIGYAREGGLNSAIRDFTKAIDLNPAHTDAYYNRGVAYDLSGARAEAAADMKKVLELTDDPGLRERANRLLEKIGSE